MSTRNLEFLFKPRSVAVIGATARPGAVGGTVMRNLLDGGFAGPVLPVNPKRPVVEGLASFASVAELPLIPDLAVVCTPPGTVPGVISELGRRGTRAAVVITAGFGDNEGSKLRGAVLEAARPHLLRIMGPNCVGLQVPPLGLNASFAHLMAGPGDIALVTQSGAVATTMIDWAHRNDIGLSCVASLGDMSDVDFGDVLDYLASSPDTRAILLYIEAVTNARKFISAARAASRSKPIVAIKSGRSAEGARAAASHTGAMASADAVYEAAFQRAGILRVGDIDELFGAAETIARAPKLLGERLAIVTNGGGLGVLATDALVTAGGRLAALSPETINALNRVLPATWSRGNPVDLIGDADAERCRAALRLVAADPGVDATLVLNCPVAVTAGLAVAKALASVAEARDHTFLACWLGGSDLQEVRQLFARCRIPSFDTPRDAINGFVQLTRHKRVQETILEVPPASVGSNAEGRASVRDVIDAALTLGRTWLDEREAKDLLRAYGVPVNPTVMASSPAEAADAASAMTASKFVVKILSPDITHKSDVGGVALDLDGPGDVRKAAGTMLDRIAAAWPDARLLGVTVQPMVRRPRAWELIVGMSVDPLFGPVILFGQGGTAVEVIGDSALALPPLNLPLVRSLIDRTRISRLLRGFRDRPAARLDSIVDVILKVAEIVADFPEIVEMDINPLLADEEGVMTIDARVRVARATAPGTQRFAIRPYPRELERNVRLADGTALLVRPIRPEDETALREMVERLRPEDVRFRFFAVLRELPRPLAARLTQIDYDREMAFVALSEAGSGDLLGVSRLAADPDNEKAEFAVTVRSDFKGRGLGWLLMQHLIDYARTRKTGMLHGAVLRENQAMIKLCQDLGFTVQQDSSDPATLKAVLRLPRS